MSATLTSTQSCVIIPTYNNAKTLERVIKGVLAYSTGGDVIVVNDGSTDDTESVLDAFKDQLIIVTNEKNSGKGYSLKRGFKTAFELGFKNAITIDSDGQHYPDDIQLFLNQLAITPGVLLMGSRNMEQEGVPGKSSFGNKFSNFWYKLETGIELPDTQTGFRSYPLEPLSKLKLFTTKFELEIEVIVKLAWKGVEVMPINIKVLYDKNERVSHFRPFKDFSRISVLNTYFVTLTLLYYLPKRIILGWKKKSPFLIIKEELFKEGESSWVKALSIGFGFFMGIVPLWGFQLLIGIPLSIYFKLNKVLFIAAANISVPPLIPFVVFFSYSVGAFFVTDNAEIPELSAITLETIHINFMQYAIGGVVLAIIMGVLGIAVSYVGFKVFRK